jgi:hypothetical protein
MGSKKDKKRKKEKKAVGSGQWAAGKFSIFHITFVICYGPDTAQDWQYSGHNK